LLLQVRRHITTVRACGLHVNATSEATHPAGKIAFRSPDATNPLKA